MSQGKKMVHWRYVTPCWLYICFLGKGEYDRILLQHFSRVYEISKIDETSKTNDKIVGGNIYCFFIWLLMSKFDMKNIFKCIRRLIPLIRTSISNWIKTFFLVLVLERMYVMIEYFQWVYDVLIQFSKDNLAWTTIHIRKISYSTKVKVCVMTYEWNLLNTNFTKYRSKR